MPPFNFRLPELPAEVHDTAVPQAREVTEASVEVFHVDAHFQDFVETMANLFQSPEIVGAGEASPAARSFGAGPLGLRFGPLQNGLRPRDHREVFFQARNQLIGF